MLTASDLYTDTVLVRKIARIQATGPDSDSESDALPRGTQSPLHQEIGSDDDEADGGDGRGARASRLSTQVKDERLRSTAVAMVGGRPVREVSMVPATQLEAQGGYIPASTAETTIVDLEDEDEEEDEEEEEDDDEDEDEE